MGPQHSATTALFFLSRPLTAGSGQHVGTNQGGTPDRLAPVVVDGSRIFTQVACGKYHGCAVAQDGTMICWGEQGGGGGGGHTQVNGAQMCCSQVEWEARQEAACHRCRTWVSRSPSASAWLQAGISMASWATG